MIFFSIPDILVNVQLPYLQALGQISHLQMPFARYLQAPMPNEKSDMKLSPPSYTSSPRFSWNTSALSRNTADNGVILRNTGVRPNHPLDSLPSAETLTRGGKLDESQAKALIHCLSSELALIEGPPGTGKSYIGLQIVQTLINSGIRPIQIVCVTNHALDQFIELLLERKVTQRIVRIGNRSKSEIVRSYNLNARQASGLSRVSRSEVKGLHERIEEVSRQINQQCELAFRSNHELLPGNWLREEYPDWYQWITNPPSAIETALELFKSSQWQSVKRSRAAVKTDDPSILAWLEGRELEARANILEERVKNASEATQTSEARVTMLRPKESKKTDKKKAEVIAEFNRLISQSDLVPAGSTGPSLMAIDEQWLKSPDPCGNRDADEIFYENLSPWELSLPERTTLYIYWLEIAYLPNSEDLVRQKLYLKDLNDELQAIYDSDKASYCGSMDIIAATTTGAATYLNIIQSATPQVLLVEEAGEVLEGQIWATLTSSVRHLILIGDHLQLRPHVNSYHLSMDSKDGQYYRADQSMFERLIGSDIKYACLETQRRMRPTISSLIRPLYPRLQDHPSTSKYPNVKGIQSNVIFMSHNFPEDSDHNAQHTSHSNSKEAEFVAELASYILKQGYDGRISIITPYVRQVKILREYIEKAGVRLKEDPTEEHGPTKADNSLPKAPKDAGTLPVWPSQVRLACVDNFQGEEDDIIILSLVRNSKTAQTCTRKNTSIGFLKSPNRSNVALSRARHGLFILGDAGLLENSGNWYWKAVMSDLKSANLIRDGIPACCKRHPSERSVLKLVEHFKEFTPEGGCRRPCGTQRPCGHVCNRRCHPDDSEHTIAMCKESCDQVLACDHPCPSLCHYPKLCLPCQVPMKNIVLPCGHTAPNVPCGKLSKLNEISCRTLISWTMPCGHDKMSPCSLVRDKMATDDCKVVCDELMDCCGRKCQSTCSDCRRLTARTDSQEVKKHTAHECAKIQHCGHKCQSRCPDVHCPPCSQPCELSCEHHQCRHSCGTRCVPCKDRCGWACEHQACELPCITPCVRPVCNEPCKRLLRCKHPCPSVCGEECLHQNCLRCGRPEILDQVADLLMMKKLGELDPKNDPDERIITLECRHSFTVESLDGLFGLHEYYTNGSAKFPSDGPVVRKLCPSCRHPIKPRFARRYGRPILFAKLQLLEEESYRQSSFQLDTVNNFLDDQRASPKNSKIISIRHLNPKLQIDTVLGFQETALEADDPILINPHVIFDLQCHGFSIDATIKWGEVLKAYKKAYDEVCLLATRKQPMQEAFEAGLTHIYRRLVQQAEKSSEGSETSNSLMSRARHEMGACPPPSINRIVTDACKMEDSILVAIIKFAFEVLKSIKSEKAPILEYQWKLYLKFLLKLRVRNKRFSALYASKLRLTTHEAPLWELHARALVEELNFITAEELDRSKEERDTEFLSIISASYEEAMKYLDDAIARWEEVCRATSSAGLPEELVATKNTCTDLKRSFVHILNCLSTGIWIEKGMIEERKMVMKAIGFQAGFHWFECPNGHIYCIGECGGAMQQSNCPDCGAHIGGDNHDLTEGNVLSQGMENLALEMGARPRAGYMG